MMMVVMLLLVNRRLLMMHCCDRGWSLTQIGTINAGRVMMMNRINCA